MNIIGPATLASTMIERLMSQTNRQMPRPIYEAQQGPRRISPHTTRIIYEGGGERVEYDIDSQGNRTRVTPTTGPTARLVCRACGDTPPVGARFCIECGAAL